MNKTKIVSKNKWSLSLVTPRIIETLTETFRRSFQNLENRLSKGNMDGVISQKRVETYRISKLCFEIPDSLNAF
jgi:acetyl-CoA carboxylase beta subunit